MKNIVYIIFIFFFLSCNGKKDEKTLFLIKENNKYGYIDVTGATVIQPQYDKALEFEDGLAYVKSGEKWGVMGTDGILVVKTEYDDVDIRPDGTFAIKMGRSWGLADANGKILIAPQFDSLDQFTEEGLIKVELGNKYGYVNKKGKYIINLNYYDADAFSEGLASVMTLDGYNINCGYIDKKGTIVIKPQYQEAYHFIQGFALVKIGGKYGFIDKKGIFVINPQFNGAFFFLGDIAPVVFNWKVGFINKKGEYVIQPEYDEYDIGLNGNLSKQSKASLRKILSTVKSIKVKKDKKWGLIDLTGKVIIPFEYEYLSTVKEGMVIFKKDKKYGIMDIQKKIIISNSYADISLFSEGLSVAAQEMEKEVVETYNTWDGTASRTVKRKMNFYGYIDQASNPVIDYKYAYAEDFKNGLARVALEKKDVSYDYNGTIIGFNNWIYIDKNGKQIWPKPSETTTAPINK